MHVLRPFSVLRFNLHCVTSVFIRVHYSINENVNNAAAAAAADDDDNGNDNNNSKNNNNSDGQNDNNDDDYLG